MKIQIVLLLFLLMAGKSTFASPTASSSLRVRHIAVSRTGQTDESSSDISEILSRNRFPATNCISVATGIFADCFASDGSLRRGKMASSPFRLEWQPTDKEVLVLRVWTADSLSLTTTFRLGDAGSPVILGGFANPNDKSSDPATHLFVFDIQVPSEEADDSSP